MRFAIETTSGSIISADNLYVYRNQDKLEYWVSKVDPLYVCKVLRFENDGVVYERWSRGSGYKTFDSYMSTFFQKWLLDDNQSVHFPGRERQDIQF